jgi:hypothetical protein
LKKLLIISFLSVAFSLNLNAQHSSRLDSAISFPDKIFNALDRKAAAFEKGLDKQTERYLGKLRKQEQKLRKKLWKKDSTLAKQMFDGIGEKYDRLKNATANVTAVPSNYSAHLDSLSTALRFLKAGNISASPELQKALASYGNLQEKLNASEQVRQFLTQRRQQLKQQFEALGMVKDLKKFRKQVYYYQSQLREYKTLFEDPSKLEQKLMEVVMRLPQFREFYARNSMLSAIFPLPGSPADPNATVQGLQPRQAVMQSIAGRFGGDPSAASRLQQNIQAAQGQVSDLRSRLSSYSSGTFGNGGDDDIPGFKPNAQKTKPLRQRLEFGSNIQTQRARYFFPVTSDIGLSLGYKLNDKSVIGIGCSYKVGWGSSWSNLRVTHQGVGLRSYLDWKIKGEFYATGGYEQNYRSLIQSVGQLKDLPAWQQSGMLGVSKRYALGKKMKGEVKVLWDFLSYQQVPKTQPIVFRIGYQLK